MLIGHMDKYIQDLKPMPVNRQDSDDRDLTKEERRTYKSYLAKARWPIAKLAPELMYGISALAQGKTAKKVVHVRALNEIIDRLHAMKAKGLARLRFVPMDLNNIALVTVMDASFANEPGRKSQAGLISLMTAEAIKREAVDCNICEFQSSAIPRVVRSTMAAESASLSTALDSICT